LGGDQSFADVHPDLAVESYGYRNVTQYGSNPALLGDLLRVEGPYVSNNPELLKKYSIKASPQVAVLRLIIDKGSESPNVSCDTHDSMFRITPTQVRLVTEKNGERTQRYPIGILWKGTDFEAMPLDVGHTIDDYVGGKVVQDWVFQLDMEEKPRLVEVKQLARKEVFATDKPLASRTDYPQHTYKENAGSISVLALGAYDRPMRGATVRLVPAMMDAKKVQLAIATANSRVERALSGDEPWASKFGTPGVPPRQLMAQASSEGNVGNAEMIGWRPLISLLMMGGAEADGDRNNRELPKYFQSKIVEPFIDGVLRGKAEADAEGRAEMPRVAPGRYSVIVDGKTDGGFYCVFVADVTVEKKAKTNVDTRTAAAAYIVTPMP